MLSKGKGRIAAIILARAKDKDADKSDSADEKDDWSDYGKGDDAGGDDGDPGLESAADDIIDASKAGDAKALVQALCAFIDQYKGSDEPDGDEPDSDDKGY